MYFDRAVNQFEAGIGVILLTLENEVIPTAKKLVFWVMNNGAEYEACVMGMEAMGIHCQHWVTQYLYFCDSMLVMNQATN